MRIATLIASSDGIASASSSEFVCIDCTPPSTPARACSAVRATLFSGCWAVSETPAVCACVRSIQERGSLQPSRSRVSRAHRRRAARNFAISSKKSLWMSKKNESRGATASTSIPLDTARSRYVTPAARVRPSSSTAVAPASRMW